MLVRLFYKFIKKGVKKGSGRNQSGKITVGSRSSFYYRQSPVPLIDYFQNLSTFSFLILKISFVSYKKAFIALIYYKTFGLFSYVLAANDFVSGLVGLNNIQIKSGFDGKWSLSNAEEMDHFDLISSNFLGCFPLGVKVFNVEIKPGSGNFFVRAPGAFATLSNKLTLVNGKEFYGVILPSGLLLYLSFFCKASLGLVSNRFVMSYTFDSAGSLKIRNKRPKVRGVAMNPVDHPHGGGEGKTSGGRVSVTPWGFLTKGKKTLKFKKKKIRLIYLTRLKKNSV